jgi:hypothetical protein
MRRVGVETGCLREELLDRDVPLALIFLDDSSPKMSPNVVSIDSKPCPIAIPASVASTLFVTE